MIIQHPDGSYEYNCLSSPLALWLQGLLRGAWLLAVATRRRATQHVERWWPAPAGNCGQCNGGQCA